MTKSEDFSEEEYEKIVKRHEEIVDLVGQILKRGTDDKKYTYADAARILVHQPTAAVMIALLLQSNATPDDVSAFTTALIHEEILQKTPTMSMVHEQRRLH